MGRSFVGQSGLPLGLRNNNPGNIRPGDNWKGMIGVNSGFVVFSDIEYGIRAMATDIIGDIVKDGKDTIEKLITEYAPPSENNTTAYINNVVKYTGIPKDQKIPLDIQTSVKLLRAIMNVELGVQYSKLITDDEIKKGISMVSSSLLQRVKNFFVNNPAVSAAVGMGLLAVAIVIILILTGKIKTNERFFNR